MKYYSICFFLSFLGWAEGFNLTINSNPKSPLQEGSNVTLWCQSESKFKWCTFKHENKICERRWKNQKRCNDFKGRAKMLCNKQTVKNICKIELKHVTLEDAGEWICEIEAFIKDKERGGNKTFGYITLDVKEKVKPEKLKLIEINNHQNTFTVKEKAEAELSCRVNKPYEWCRFEHVNVSKGCYLQMDAGNISFSNCSDEIKHRIDLSNSDSHFCAMKLQVEIEDIGKWKCLLSENEEKVEGEIDVEVEFEMTNEESVTNIGKVNLGGDVILNCPANQPFESCTFEHADKKCENRLDHDDSYHCSDFKDRIEFIEMENKFHEEYECEIKLKSVTKYDDGIWICILETSAGQKIYGNMTLNVQIEIKNDEIINQASIYGMGTTSQDIENGKLRKENEEKDDEIQKIKKILAKPISLSSSSITIIITLTVLFAIIGLLLSLVAYKKRRFSSQYEEIDVDFTTTRKVSKLIGEYNPLTLPSEEYWKKLRVTPKVFDSEWIPIESENTSMGHSLAFVDRKVFL